MRGSLMSASQPSCSRTTPQSASRSRLAVATRPYLNKQVHSRSDRHTPHAEELSATEKGGNSFKPLKDIEDIQKVLPHRFPFLLVDRVVELDPQKYAVGYKNVTANDNFFTGHFPERKIMPGVLQVEAMAQLGGMVMLDSDGVEQSEQQLFFFGGIESCKFRRPVVPGDTLMMRCELLKFNKRYGIAKIAGKAYVGNELSCEAELTLIRAPKD